MYKLIAIAYLIWVSAYYPPLRPYVLVGMLIMLGTLLVNVST